MFLGDGQIKCAFAYLDAEFVFIDNFAIEGIGKALGSLDLHLLCPTVDEYVLHVLAVEMLAVGIGSEYLHKAQTGDWLYETDFDETVIGFCSGGTFE